MSKYFILSLALFALFSCKNLNQKSSENTRENTTENADFTDFYEKFHSDSLFQVEHIAWPLNGMRAVEIDSQSVMQKYTWQPEEWTMHRLAILNNGDYEQELTWMDNDFVSERVRLKNSSFGLERHFSRFNNSWELVFYSEMHEMK